jgi:aldehyde:ferredoxin oxidoreductase
MDFKIMTADLDEETIAVREESFTAQSDYGRGLVLRLLAEHIPENADRLDPDNALVFVPGLFVNSSAPSACRMLVAAKKGKGKGAHISNITGDTPHRLVSSGISALVIKGKAKKKGAVLYIDEGNPVFLSMPELCGLPIPAVLSVLRGKFGDNCSFVGTGPVADACLPLSTMFVSYPQGSPSYSCPRDSLGDIAGSKNLKALVIRNKSMFKTSYFDKDSFAGLSPALSNIIRSNNICGKALPECGTAVLMKISDIKRDMSVCEKLRMHSFADMPGGIKINHKCSPICVIGCLNRGNGQTVGDGFQNVQEVAEIAEGLTKNFGINDEAFVRKLTAKAFEIGIHTTEFLHAAKLYFEAEAPGRSVGLEDIYNLMLEVEKLSFTGRVISGGTSQVYALYKDKAYLQKMVSRPSIEQEKNFAINLVHLDGTPPDISAADLLYREIFLLENLGFCMFTSFAILDNQKALDILGDMFHAKTGIDASLPHLLAYSKICLEKEMEFHKESAFREIKTAVPEFTKILYKYFGNPK